MATNTMPKGYHSVTPFISVNDVQRLIQFAKAAFDAKENSKLLMPDGRPMHADIQIGDSVIMLGEASNHEEMVPGCVYLYVDDADRVYEQAMNAGATSIQAPTDQFWGDRAGGVKDFAGNRWWIATHKEDVPQHELEARAAKMFGGPRD